LSDEGIPLRAGLGNQGRRTRGKRSAEGKLPAMGKLRRSSTRWRKPGRSKLDVLFRCPSETDEARQKPSRHYSGNRSADVRGRQGAESIRRVVVVLVVFVVFVRGARIRVVVRMTR